MVEYVILRFLLLLNGEVLENSSETPNRPNRDNERRWDNLLCFLSAIET